MNRILPLLALAATLLVAGPAAAEPASSNTIKAETSSTSIATLENELYAEARVTRDLMAALHDSGRLGTPEGQAEMAALTLALEQVKQQVSVLRGQRQVLMAQRKAKRASTRSVVAIRDRAQTPANTTRNARR